MIKRYDKIEGVEEWVENRVVVYRRYDTGNEYWFDEQGEHHRDNAPAIIKCNGDHVWIKHGLRHRTEGPAFHNPDGYQEWWNLGKPHRFQAPAVIHADGSEEWYRYGLRHRDDGPAVIGPAMIDAGEPPQWWINGYRIKSASRYKILADLTDEQMLFLILKYGDFK